jgi:hypothetical protein
VREDFQSSKISKKARFTHDRLAPMKNLSFTISIVALFSLVGCDNYFRRPEKDSAPRVTKLARPDLAKLPLKEALKTKYSRLQLVCDYEFKYKIQISANESIGGQSQDRVMIWDILQDFQESKLIRFSKESEYMSMTLAADLQVNLNLGNLTSKSVEGERHIRFSLRDWAELKGPVNFSVIYKTPSGNVGSGIEDNIHFPDRLTRSIYNGTTTSPVSDAWRFDCTLEAEVNSGFDSDFKNDQD